MIPNLRVWRPGDPEEAVARLGDRRRIGRLLGAAGDKVLKRLAVAVGHRRQREALLEEVLGHSMPHEPDADETDSLCHVVPPECVARPRVGAPRRMRVR